MNRSIIAVLLAGAMVAACSSKGEAGPAGPSGPRGDQGLQGSPGQPGESVLSAQLSVGSIDCPNGGSQFTSVSGATFACNGALGPSGPPGPSGPQGVQGVQGPVGPPGSGQGLTVIDSLTGPLGSLLAKDTTSISVLCADHLIRRWDWFGAFLGYPIPQPGSLGTVNFTAANCTGTGYVFNGALPSTQIVYAHPMGGNKFLLADTTPVLVPAAGMTMLSYFTSGLCRNCAPSCTLPAGYLYFPLRDGSGVAYGANAPFTFQ